MVQVLLEYGLDVDAQNDYCGTPLGFSLSTHHDDARVTQLLIERGANPNTRDSGGSTPLHYASKYGRIEVARVLIEHGASVKVENNDGKTPLDVASGAQREEINKLLLL